MKLTDKQQDILFKIVLVLAVYYFIARPILQKIGIVKDKTDRLIDEQQNLTAQQNAFSPNFYKYSPSGSLLLTRAKAEQLANELFDALGYWYDDEAKVKGVFMQLKTKAQVSFLSDIFSQIHKQDMLEFLKKGKGLMPEAGINSSELGEIINIVNNLSKYKL